MCSARTKYQHRHAKLTACADQGSANASSRGNTLFCASARPGTRLRKYFASFAHSPTPSDSIRSATPLNQRLHVLGAVQLTGCDVDTLQRPAQRVHRRLERIESPDGLGALAPRPPQGVFGLAPARLVARAYLAQSPQRLTFAFNRCIGARRRRTLFIS